MRKNLVSLIIITLFACTPAKQSLDANYQSSEDSRLPKNVVLLIGDGMGLSQVSGAIYSSKQTLAFEAFTTPPCILTA